MSDGYGDFGGGLGAGLNGFPDPWLDYASTQMPESTSKILRWSEFILSANGIYRQAISRILSYFITSVEVGGDISDDVKSKYETYLSETLDIKNVLHAVGQDYLTYGVSFTMVWSPIRRYLSCPRCHSEYPLHNVNEQKDTFSFSFAGFQFNARCPKCKYTGDWGKPLDRKGHLSDYTIKRFSPHEMEIEYDLGLSENRKFLWKIPGDLRQAVIAGRPIVLENNPWELIEAIRQNKYFRFAPDIICYLHEAPLAGFTHRGWGISTVMANFRQAWLVQMLNKYQEAIISDYTVPFRVLTPAATGGADPAARDPILNLNMSSFVARTKEMLRRRRRDPATWNVLPFPLQYQALGGDARALAPKELLDQALEVLLTSIGIPVEFFKGSLQVATAPVALRLLEVHWSHLVHALNKFLAHLSKKLQSLLSWEPVTLTLQKSKVADDTERTTLLLQLASGQQISQQTALAQLDLKFKDELKRRNEEARITAEEQQKNQELMQSEDAGAKLIADPASAMQAQQGQQGGQQQGGGQAQGGQGDPSQQQPQAAGQDLNALINSPVVSPQDMIQKSEAIASQLLSMPDTARQQQLTALRTANPTLHLLVRATLEKQRSSMRSQSYAQAKSQVQGQGG